MADKKKILFWPDVYKEQGHWLPTLAWAEYLHSMKDGDKERFDIQYMGIEDCREIVEKYPLVDADGQPASFTFNSIFERIYPQGYTNEVQTTPSSRWKKEHIWALAYAGFDSGERKDFNISDATNWDANKIFNFFDDLKPGLLVSGYFTALETLIIYYHKKNRIIFMTI